MATWLEVFGNEQITVYTIAISRGHEVVLEILDWQVAGALVSDCFLAYDGAALWEWLQQKCVAHLLLELRELTETKTWRAREFAAAVVGVLRAALVLKVRAGTPDLRSGEYEAATVELEARFDQLLDEKQQWRDADNACILERLRNYQPDILRFSYWEELDATNNLAERQLRTSVVTPETGGGHCTDVGAAPHTILGSILTPGRQQAVGILEYLIKLQQFGSTPPALVPAAAALSYKCYTQIIGEAVTKLINL